MKRVKFLLVLAACMLVLAGCSSGGIRGTWTDEQGITYTFEKKGSMSITASEDSEPLAAKYVLTPDGGEDSGPTGEITIQMSVSGETDKDGNFLKFESFKGRYKLEDSDKKLTITGDDGSVSILFKN